MLRKSLPILLAAFAWFASVLAQTNAEYQQCADDLVPIDDPLARSIYLDDPTFFNVTWRYDPNVCTTNFRIGTSRIWVGESRVTCSRGTFDGSGRLYMQCSITNGDLAQLTLDEMTDQVELDVRLGQTTALGRVQTYTINPLDPADRPAEPVPSGTLRKRRAEDQHVFDCPIGHTYCWTGQGRDYACMDTSSDVTACGRCPYAAGAEEADCTSIEGVDDVECRSSRCVVNACQRGFQISLDRTKCVDGRKRSLRSAYF